MGGIADPAQVDFGMQSVSLGGQPVLPYGWQPFVEEEPHVCLGVGSETFFACLRQVLDLRSFHFRGRDRFCLRIFLEVRCPVARPVLATTAPRGGRRTYRAPW